MDEQHKEETTREEHGGTVERKEAKSQHEDAVEVLAEVLDIEDPEEKEKLISVLFARSFSGPVPPPQILQGYDKAVEGGGKWLLDYTKDEQRHRHKMDERQIRYYSFGQYFGFTLGLVGIAGGLYLALQGAEWFGFAAFFTSLISLVGLFVYNRRAEAREEAKRRKKRKKKKK